MLRAGGIRQNKTILIACERLRDKSKIEFYVVARKNERVALRKKMFNVRQCLANGRLAEHHRVRAASMLRNKMRDVLLGVEQRLEEINNPPDLAMKRRGSFQSNHGVFNYTVARCADTCRLLVNYYESG